MPSAHLIPNDFFIYLRDFHNRYPEIDALVRNFPHQKARLVGIIWRNESPEIREDYLNRYNEARVNAGFAPQAESMKKRQERLSKLNSYRVRRGPNTKLLSRTQKMADLWLEGFRGRDLVARLGDLTAEEHQTFGIPEPVLAAPIPSPAITMNPTSPNDQSPLAPDPFWQPSYSAPPPAYNPPYFSYDSSFGISAMPNNVYTSAFQDPFATAYSGMYAPTYPTGTCATAPTWTPTWEAPICSGPQEPVAPAIVATTNNAGDAIASGPPVQSVASILQLDVGVTDAVHAMRSLAITLPASGASSGASYTTTQASADPASQDILDWSRFF